MNLKVTKALKDLRLRPRRTFLVIFAMGLGIWGIGTVLVAYSILTRDLDANYQMTNPMHLAFEGEGLEDLDLEAFRNQPEVEHAEFRDFSMHRIEVHPDHWIPLLLYGVSDFEGLEVAKFFPQEGQEVPDRGTMLIERDGRLVSNLTTGSKAKVRVGGKVAQIPIAGITFDPAQAPATQDAFIYAFTDQETYREISGLAINQRLIVRLQGVESEEEVRALGTRMVEGLRADGLAIDGIKVPPFNEHPHQWQLNTLLFLIGAIGLLAFIMSIVLVSQLMKSVMARQVRQIGILKAIGASRFQVLQIYLAMLLVMGIVGGLLGVPLAVKTGMSFSYFVAAQLNFDILTTSPPVGVYTILVLGSILSPVLLSGPILLKGTGISVRQALDDQGIVIEKTTVLKRVFKNSRLPNTFILALRNSLRNMRRLTVTILTMALGVAIFSTGFNVRQSLQDLLTGLKDELGYDVQVVFDAPISRDLALAPFAGLPNVEMVEAWSGGRGKLQSEVVATNNGTGIVALPYASDLLKLKLIDGEWINSAEKGQVVMNQQAWELYGHPGLGANFSLKVGEENLEVKLVGIAEQFDRAKIYMDQREYDAHFNPGHLVNSLMFVARDNDYGKVINMKRDIEVALGKTSLEVLFVMSEAERVKIIYDHLDIILSIIVFLSFLVLLVSAIGMASATSINIGERTREIGVMRAIGATPRTIYKIFVNEGMIIGGVSIILGLAISFPLSQLASVFFGNLVLGEKAILHNSISPVGFWITLGVTLLFSWIASRIPARAAVRVPTHEALAWL